MAQAWMGDKAGTTAAAIIWRLQGGRVTPHGTGCGRAAASGRQETYTPKLERAFDDSSHMNISSHYLGRMSGAASVAAVCLLVLSQTAQAEDHHHRRSQRSTHLQQIYSSHPRSGFTLSLGDGYRGRGYYYGPPHSEYYYERPDVSFYATRELAPREYYSNDYSGSGSTGVSVQRALAQRGYYHGPIDGAIGPQSSRAIARYQEEHGMRPTGAIGSSLLQSLGL